MKTMTYEAAVKLARESGPDAYYAADCLGDAGCPFTIARAALRAVFGYDVLA